MIFYYIWEDKTISFVDARNKHEAAEILDEIGDAVTSKIKKFDAGEYKKNFFVTFKLNPKHNIQNVEDDSERFLLEEGEYSEDMWWLMTDVADKLK